MNNSDLVFVRKSESSGGTTRSDIDVSVTIIDKGNIAGFSFSAKATTILGKPEYIMCAMKNGRIYFVDTDKKNGFKLSGNATCKRLMSKIPAKKLGVNDRWIGYYDLLWDVNRELFYIDLNGRRAC